VGLLEPFAERFEVSLAPLPRTGGVSQFHQSIKAESESSQGLIDNLELPVNELARERELNSHGRTGGGGHVSRRRWVMVVVHALGTMLRQIVRHDDRGGHGDDNGGGDNDKERAKVEGDESNSGDRLETGRGQCETLADELDRRTLSRFDGGTNDKIDGEPKKNQRGTANRQREREGNEGTREETTPAIKATRKRTASVAVRLGVIVAPVRAGNRTDAPRRQNVPD
jgi:hypothetical protein